MRIRQRLISAILLALLWAGIPADARAEATYCSAGATLASLTEMQFRGSGADDCFGIASGGADTTPDDLWGGGWSTHLGDGLGERTDSALGATWTLNPATLLKPTSWSLRTSSLAAPVTVDIVAVVSGFSLWSAYLFTAETFSAAGLSNGSFGVSFANIGLPIPHLDLYIRPASTATTVPDGDPGVLQLLGFALAGIVTARALRPAHPGAAAGIGLHRS